MKKGGNFGMVGSREGSMEEREVGVDTKCSVLAGSKEVQGTNTSSLAVSKTLSLV